MQGVRRSETIVFTSCCSHGGFWGKPPRRKLVIFTARRRVFLQGINHYSHIRSSQQGAVETLQTTRLIRPRHSTPKRQSQTNLSRLQTANPRRDRHSRWGGCVWDAAQIENESMQPGREKNSLERESCSILKQPARLKWVKMFCGTNENNSMKKKYRTFHYLYPVLNQDTEPFHPFRAIVSSSFHPSCQRAYGSDCNTTGNDGGQ